MKLLKPSLLLLIAGLLVLPICAHSQETKKEKKPREKDYFSLDFNLDYSFALGNYGKTDRATYKSGYAANGWAAIFGFNWLGPRGWGLTIQPVLQHNPYQDTAVNLVPYGMKYPLGSGGWWNIYLLAGPAYIHDFGPWELNVKALAGLIISESTNFNVTSPIDTSNVSLTGTGWGYGLNISFGYKITKSFGINLNVSYLGGATKATKKYGAEVLGWRAVTDPLTGETIWVALSSPETKYEIKRSVSTLNAGIGVIYHF